VLRFAAAAEQKFHHPIALAILHEARDRGLDLPPVDDSEFKVGFGIAVRLEGHLVRVGSRRYIEMEGIAIPPDVAAAIERAQTTTFCVAAFAQLLFAIGCRSDRFTAFGIGFFRNPALLAAIAISALLQVAVVTLPVARPVFEVRSELGSGWPFVIGLALVPVTVIEAVKLVCRVSRRRG
jgi:magnesium-transporting ATPase (P-type)